MLMPDDEFAHEPPAPIPPGWQENWYLLGWDTEQAAGFSLHLGRIPGEDRLAAKACVLTGGAMTPASIDAPLGAELKAPGLEIDIDPFRTWRVALDTTDEAGRSLGFDVIVDSLLPPVDWREALASLMASGTERDHYEVGDRWIGTSIAVDSAGTRVVPAHEVEVAAGDAAPAGYGSVVVRAAPAADGPPTVEISATTAAHAHVPYPEWAQGFWLNDAFCSAEWNGRRGFGIVELNRIDR